MRAIAWLIGVCFVLAGLFVGVLAVVGGLSEPSTFWFAIGAGVIAWLMIGYGANLMQWSKRSGETTLAGYERLPIGGTLDECVTHLGGHGRQLTSSTEKVEGKTVERKQCFWTNKDESYCEIILENGRVASKSQIGLH